SEAARRADPAEQAKTILRRRGRVAYSMSVHGGRADLFFVSGIGKDLTFDELLAAAKRVSA
ncbi:MAG: hypothetical protein ABIQ32_12460, partial [Sphingomicrobium sp.]